MGRDLRLGSHVITPLGRPYIIAEIGVNHEGSMDKAKEMIKSAKEGGAHAAKFQSYKAETIAAKESPSYWDLSKEPTTNQFALFKKYDNFGQTEYEQLAAYCHEVNIDFLSTPFDNDAVEFLDPLMLFFKVASADITNTPFLRLIASKGKLVILSTGASTLEEIEAAVKTVTAHGNGEIALLHCILNYPTDNTNAHLGMIHGLKEAFPDCIIGYSDHTLPDRGMHSLSAAYLLGAQILEKHYTFDKTLPGNDHYHAMDLDDLKNFARELQTYRELLGPTWEKGPISTEEISRQNARRSIVLTGAVKSGATVAAADLTYKRPASGISPLHWDEVIGKTYTTDLEEDHILQWDDLS